MWCRFFFEVNATNSISATSASETHCSSCSSHTAWGYLIGVHALGSIEVIAALTAGFIRAVTENHAPARRAVEMKAWVKYAESARTMTRQEKPAARAVACA